MAEKCDIEEARNATEGVGAQCSEDERERGGAAQPTDNGQPLGGEIHNEREPKDTWRSEATKREGKHSREEQNKRRRSIAMCGKGRVESSARGQANTP